MILFVCIESFVKMIDNILIEVVEKNFLIYEILNVLCIMCFICIVLVFI